ncbi:MAG: DUF3782 domain-containing protein [Verrucomicrobia bacterium]|nr:DUF3782 domain-containing protein [Verrucomicrobiota bacterium]
MTDKELKDLVASLAVAQKETDRQLKETDRQLKETDRQLKETDLRQKETDRQLKESNREVQEFRRAQLEINLDLKRTVKELGQQIGGLGNKFGDFAEGMAMPSLVEILAKHFGAEQIIETRLVRKGEDEIELDLIGTSNGHAKSVVAAEVKSVLNRRELDKFIRNLRRFFEFFPHFKGYDLYGVLAVVKSSKEMDQLALAQGIGVARMRGDIFRLTLPSNFRPKNFAA